MDFDEAASFFERFCAVWAAKDPAQFQALFHPDAVVRQPPVRHAFAGNQVADYFAQVFAGLPDLILQPLEWTWRNGVVMIEWEITATIGDEPTSWRGVDRFRLRAGLVEDEWVFYDSLRVWERLDPSMNRDDMITLP